MHSSQQKCNNCSKADLKKREKYKYLSVLVQSLSLSQGELKCTLVNKNATNAVRQTLKKRKVLGILLGVGLVTVIITRGVKIHSSQQKCNRCSKTDLKKEKSTRNTFWCWFSHSHYHKGS